ncbi:hypothetical protein VA7868_03523 [Vibrio aerogenes CECT 7868]|uniref:Uncharacterized protein n=1 Tax=Vibrio aerogenes CECT 7868 TaxID=1216006 RepID=A0A1M6AAA4_9VIBR|nr:hypothetical protein [Vibrio aerogenes]SHI33358.1 hypothetical protein VA7868_03523 [Vibrio aerogenes CECT 7868]
MFKPETGRLILRDMTMDESAFSSKARISNAKSVAESRCDQ